MVEIDWNDLLVDDDDLYADPVKVTIELEPVKDEDGDIAIAVHLQAIGLTKRELLQVLVAAYNMAETGLEDSEEEEEDDDDDDY